MRTCLGFAITTFFTCGATTAAAEVALPVASITTTQPPEPAVVPYHCLGEGAMDIQSDNAHDYSLLNGSVKDGSLANWAFFTDDDLLRMNLT